MGRANLKAIIDQIVDLVKTIGSSLFFSKIRQVLADVSANPSVARVMKAVDRFPVTILVPILILMAGVTLLNHDPKSLQTLRNSVFDQFQRLHPREYVPVPVRIVDIDEQSLERIGQWPWPRITVAKMVTKLREAGAKVIGFDVIFAEQDRTSPKSMMRLWNPEKDIRQLIASLPDHDESLAKTLSEGRDIVLGFAVEREGVVESAPPRPYRVMVSGEPVQRFLHGFSEVAPSLKQLAQSAEGHGALTFVPGVDGVIRHVPLMIRLGNEVMPSLSTELLRVAQGAQNFFVKTAPEDVGTGMEKIRVGEFTIPTTPNGELWMHYTEPTKQRYVPAWGVLSEKLPANRLKDSIVLVGSSAQGLMDLRFSPRGIIPGVEVHAQALEQILSGTFLERPAWGNGIEILMVVIGGMLVGMAALYTRALVSALVTGLIIGFSLWAAWTAFVSFGLLLDPVTPGLVVLTTFIVSSLVHHFSTEMRQRWVKEAFSRYVSPNLVEHLVDNPGQLELGGERRECSFVFTDLAGFTSLMESVDPGEAVTLLNDYLDEMIAIAFRNEGTLDRIVGDAVAILFSAPVEQEDHRSRAYQCALEMDEFGRRYAKEANENGFPLGKTRVGVHSGEVIIGNFGGQTVFDYRALGDPINTAARLESVNKHLGTNVCISEKTLEGCENARVRPVGRLVLKGKTEPLMVYEPIAAQADMPYETAFNQLRDKSDKALESFEKLMEERPDDPLVNLHLKRIQAGESGDLIVMASK